MSGSDFYASQLLLDADAAWRAEQLTPTANGEPVGRTLNSVDLPPSPRTPRGATAYVTPLTDERRATVPAPKREPPRSTARVITPVATSSFLWPTHSKLVSRSITSTHNGADISGPVEPIRACESGTISLIRVQMSKSGTGQIGGGGCYMHVTSKDGNRGWTYMHMGYAAMQARVAGEKSTEMLNNENPLDAIDSVLCTGTPGQRSFIGRNGAVFKQPPAADPFLCARNALGVTTGNPALLIAHGGYARLNTSGPERVLRSGYTDGFEYTMLRSRIVPITHPAMKAYKEYIELCFAIIEREIGTPDSRQWMDTGLDMLLIALSSPFTSAAEALIRPSSTYGVRDPAIMLERLALARAYFADSFFYYLEQGDTVSRGELIGKTGRSGNCRTGRAESNDTASGLQRGVHLHLELRAKRSPTDSVNVGTKRTVVDPLDHLTTWI